MSDRVERVYTNNGAGWFVAIVLVLALAFVGYLYINNVGAGGSESVTVELQVPEALTPSE